MNVNDLKFTKQKRKKEENRTKIEKLCFYFLVNIILYILLLLQ